MDRTRGPSRATRSRLALIAAVVGVLGPFVASLNGAFLTGDDALWPLTWIAWAPVGYMIVLRRPENAVGRGFLFVSSTMGASFVFGSLSATSSIDLTLRVWFEVANVVLGVAPWIAIVWILLIFPTGSYQTVAELWVGRFLITFGALAMVAFAVSGSPMESTGRPSPLAVPELQAAASLVVDEQGFLVVIALLVAALVLLIRRWRASTGTERAQFRWLLFGALVYVVVLTLGQFVPDDSLALLLFFPAGFAIPVTIGVAVLRYHLFEIDRLISRTLGYGLVVALLAGLVLGLVSLFAYFLPTDDPLVVAVSTLAAAASFNPIRRSVQKRVDHRFNRTRYDSERVIEGFASSLSDRSDAETLVHGWVDVVSDTMQPAAVGVWVRT